MGAAELGIFWGPLRPGETLHCPGGSEALLTPGALKRCDLGATTNEGGGTGQGLHTSAAPRRKCPARPCRPLRPDGAAHQGPSAASSRWDAPRSEEHTSELQSHSDLVCRLLLEKK